MMNSITLLLAFLGEALAFHVVPSTRVVTRLESATSHENNHLNFNPMEGYRSVDMARAKECAEHFGECSLEEIQDLRDNLHKERLQRFLFEPKDITPLDDVALEHRVLEEELDLQLSMLRDHEDLTTTKTNLFPEVEEPMKELPHLKDHTLTGHAEEVIHKAEQTAALAETVLEESVLETALMCGVVALLVLAPPLFQF